MVETLLSLMGFDFDHLLKHYLQTTKCLKPSTLEKLHILIPTCCITSVLIGMLWSSLDFFSICPFLWHCSQNLKKPFDIALDVEPEKLFDIALDVEPERLFDIALDVEPEKLFDIALDAEPEKLFDIALDVEP